MTVELEGMGSNRTVTGAWINNPMIFTGTFKKAERTMESMARFYESWAERMGLTHVLASLEVITVKAEEPDHLIDEYFLIKGKGASQAIAMTQSIAEELRRNSHSRENVIPNSAKDVYIKGGVFSFITSDVGLRDREGKAGKWEEKRNYYMNPKLLKGEGDVAAMRADILAYYAQPKIYGRSKTENGLVRAFDSALAITELTYNPLDESELVADPYYVNYPNIDVHSGNSTVGVKFENHPLATFEARSQYLDDLIEMSADLGMSAVEALRSLNGKAGGTKTEYLILSAQKRGNQVTILADEDKEATKMERFFEHVEGGPYELFRDMLMTFSDPNYRERAKKIQDRFMIQLYPAGARNRNELRVY